MLDPIHVAPGERALVHFRVRPKIRGRDSFVALDLFEAPPLAAGGRARARLRVRRARLIEHVCAGKRNEIALKANQLPTDEED